jgi:hypothetical protein
MNHPEKQDPQDQVAPAPAGSEGTPKRPYSKPTLTDHGTVSALTRGGAGTSKDGRGQKKFIRP